MMYALATLALSSLAAVVGLSWALVRKTEACAGLRVDVAHADVRCMLAERDAEEVEALYRAEMERNETLVKSIVAYRKGGGSVDPLDQLDALLAGSRARIANASAVVRAGRVMRDTSAGARAATGGVDAGGDSAVPRIGTIDRGLHDTDYVSISVGDGKGGGS